MLNVMTIFTLFFLMQENRFAVGLTATKNESFPGHSTLQPVTVAILDAAPPPNQLQARVVLNGNQSEGTSQQHLVLQQADQADMARPMRSQHGPDWSGRGEAGGNSTTSSSKLKQNSRNRKFK